MKSLLAGDRHQTAQIKDFKGLLTNLADRRAVPVGPSFGYERTPTGFLSVAQDVVFDDAGNPRPRDGYSPWWPAIPQRLQLADMQPGELTWTKTGTGTMSDDTAVFFNGVQSKKLVVTTGNNATVTKTYAVATDPMNVLKQNTTGYTTGIWVAFRIAGLANVTGIDLILITSVGTFTVNHIEFGFADSVWKSVNVANYSFAAGETITSVAVKVTASGGTVTLNLADLYLAVETIGGAIPGNFFDPLSLAVDSANNIYVGENLNSRVQKLNASGTPLLQFGSFGSGNGQINIPTGLAIGPTGTIYVVDDGNSRIQMFDPAGQFLGAFGTHGSGPGQFRSPQGIAVNAAGDVFVVDNDNNNVQHFDASGNYIDQFGISGGSGNGHFESPVGIAIDVAGNIFVVDNGNFRVQKFNSAYVWQMKFGTSGSTDGKFASPTDVALDSSGNIYVMDAGNYRVQAFSPTGVFSSKFGSQGTGNTQFDTPFSMVIDGNNFIYVADRSGNVVKKFTTEGVWQTTFGRPTYTLDSFCTGAYEFRPLDSPNRFVLASFGETIYFDKNEAKAPFKIMSGLTRNTPNYFSDDQSKAYWCNGLDPNMVWTGTSYRPVGFPKPDVSGVGLAAAAGTGLTAGAYYYAVSFVYGEGSVLHGESSIAIVSASVAVSAGNLQVALTSLPIGAVGSGVVQRRIYRVTVNAPNTATFNLAAVISDNTTATYTDAMTDLVLLEQAPGSTDNGIPPVAKYMKYFSIGMVYAKGNLVSYSRPGVDLDSTPETVPALNSFTVSPAGQITGLLVFNNNLYIFQEYGFGAAQWVGDKLFYRPVLHSVQANIGCIDQNSIAIKGNDLVYWRDQKGQLQKMDIEENVTLASRNIKNLCNNFNNNLTSNLSFFESFSGKAKLANGTVGSNLNLNLDGSLSYQYQPNATMLLGAQQTALGSHLSGGNTPAAGNALVTFQSSVSLVLTANQPLALNQIGAEIVSTFGTSLNYSLVAQVYQLAAAGTHQLGPLLAQGTVHQTIGAGQHDFPVVPLDHTVYIPAGESIVVKMTGDSLSVLFMRALAGACGPFTASSCDINGVAATDTLVLRFDWQAALLTVVKSAILDGGSNLQRWAQAAVQSPLLAGGNSIQVAFETDIVTPFAAASVSNYHAAPPILYYLLAITNNYPNAEPLYNSSPGAFLYPLRDYRINDNSTTPGWTDVFPLPAPNPQQRYGRITLTMDPNRVSAPPNAANSRVSTSITTSFPSVAGVKITASSESFFANPYDPTNYSNDIYTSEIVITPGQGLLGSFGNFNVVYAQNQQKLIFQMRTGANSGAIGANPWVTVTPNQQVPASVINNPLTDVCFQYRILFQDDPSQQGSPANLGNGQTSVVYSVAVSWFGGSNGAFIIPVMPPTLVFHKDCVVGSWASLNSSLLDTTLCMDWWEDQVGRMHERFATWTGLHFGAFCSSNGKMIGGPISGGQLVRMFNSDIGDLGTVWPNAYMGVPGVIATIPQNFGSSNIKTISGVFVGCELNVFARGYVQGSLNAYSVATDNKGNSATPSFSFSISTNPAGNGLLNAVTPSALADTTLSQNYQTLLSHASLQPANLSGQFKPYENEYFIDVAEQERAFVLAVSLVPYKDPNGNSIFPSLTGLGVEFFLENYRGV